MLKITTRDKSAIGQKARRQATQETEVPQDKEHEAQIPNEH
jgi:hypothetical protein